MVKDKFGPEEAARLVNTHASKLTKEGNNSHEGNN
jgi:hypothetical protein